MIFALLESVKYVGHLFPLLVLRLYMGVYLLEEAWTRYQGSFLTQPRLAEAIRDWSTMSPAPDWYKGVLDQWMLPHWQLAAYCVVYFQFVIGIGFILGFFVRPLGIIGALLSLNFVFLSSTDVAELYRLHMVLFLVLAWMGAGRCLGVDAYFYKRNRGVWW